MSEFPTLYLATVRGVENVVVIQSYIDADDFLNLTPFEIVSGRCTSKFEAFMWHNETQVTDLRPLRLVDESREVVLDPENDEDLKRLVPPLNADYMGNVAVGFERLRWALRSLLSEPEPGCGGECIDHREPGQLCPAHRAEFNAWVEAQS